MGIGPNNRGAEKLSIGLPTNAVRNATAVRWTLSPSSTKPIVVPLGRGSARSPIAQRSTTVRHVTDDPHPSEPEAIDAEPEADDIVADQQDWSHRELTGDEMIEVARRKYGNAGAALAMGMFGLDVALGTKKKPDSVQVQEAPTDPVDIDTEGIQVPIDAATMVTAPALARRAPIGVGKRKSRRR